MTGRRIQGAIVITGLIAFAVGATANAGSIVGSFAGKTAETATVLQDSPEAFDAQLVSPDGELRSVSCRRVRSEAAQEEWTVRLTSGSGAGINAWITATADTVVVSGYVEKTQFLYVARMIAPGVVEESRSFGEARFSGEFNLANPTGSRNFLWAKRLGQFRDSVTGQPAWDTAIGSVAGLPELLANANNSASVGALGKLVATAIGASPTVQSIESYVGCLKDACRYNGGCWDVYCHRCPRDPIGSAIFSWLLYTLDAEVCWFSEIVNPFRKDVDVQSSPL